MQVSVRMFVFGSHADYEEVDLLRLIEHLLSKVSKQRFSIDDTGAGHTNDHKFDVFLNDDLDEMDDIIAKLKKILTKKPYGFKGKFGGAKIRQLFIYLWDERKGSQYITFDWDVLR